MRLYRRFLFFFLSVGLLLTSCGVGRSLRHAEQSYARGEYFDAARHYKTAYTRTSPKDRSQRGVLAYKQGDCYRRINYTLKAKGAYMNAVRYRYPDTLSHFYLAEMLRKNGEYAAAIPYYENYLAYAQTLPAGKERKDSLTQIGLTSCRLAQEWKKKPTRYIVKRVPILVSRRSDYSPMYAGDDPDILYFTSTRNEAKGTDLNGITGMKSADIFHSKRNEKKQWQKPGGLDLWRINITRDGFGYVDNLGPEINTSADEMFPTFSPDGTLYFSSTGHPGMGGLDIFRAITDSLTGRWRIENMQSPVNSQGDDFGMTFEPGAPNRGFFSSNRGDARGWDHIYSFEFPEVHHVLKGLVYDKEGDALSDALVTLVGDDGTYLKINVKKDGTFTQELAPGCRYALLASCRGYLNDKEEMATENINEDRLYELEFPLSSITRPVLIENIFYEFDKADLTSESTVALDELIELLNDNPNVTIELSAHCDYKGNDDYNLRLSQRRAESVVRYLIKGGIDPERLTPKGYGEQQPKTVTKFTLKSAPFLKEGDVLTEEFIKNLPPEQQEICNAINRRTEFKVLRTTYQ